jgi:demethylmenaquinone methyltransferase/2-methoxy-6-polyprenyl-1,4-benzoquinol methylase
LLVLEFSKVWSPLDPLYRLYTMKLLPAMGKVVANDSASYRYLAESIAKHPDQETLRQLMVDAGFERVEYFNLSAGVVALHRGYRL